jgi:hypothetical protein
MTTTETRIKYYKLDVIAPPDQAYLLHTEEKVLQLNRHHVMGKEPIFGRIDPYF